MSRRYDHRRSALWKRRFSNLPEATYDTPEDAVYAALHKHGPRAAREGFTVTVFPMAPELPGSSWGVYRLSPPDKKGSRS